MAAPVHTPARPTRPQGVPPTTPAREKPMSLPSFTASGSHRQRRKTALEEANIYQVDWNVFKGMLPCRPAGYTVGPDETWDTIAEKLRVPAELWQTLPGGAVPAGGNENRTYQALGPIFDQTINACRALGFPKPNVTLRLKPTWPPVAYTKPDRTSPDGAMIDEGIPEAEYRWEDMSVTIELKKPESKGLDGKMGEDNTEQIVWGLQHQLWGNPDKRFALGLTIEKTSVRVWQLNRVGYFVSTPIDLHERSVLMRIFASLAYATKTELGWDPTMTRLVEGSDAYKQAQARAEAFLAHRPFEEGHRQTHLIPFLVEVAESKYTAVAILADHRARTPEGSATRVFLAYKTNDDNPIPRDHAIKTLWRSDTRPPEGENYDKIIAAIQKSSTLSLEEIKQHFGNVTGHGDVLIDNELDHTHHKIMRDVDIEGRTERLDVTARASTFRLGEAIGSHHTVSYNSEGPNGRKRWVPPGPTVKPVKVMSSGRINYRLVLEDVGKPLHHEGNLSRSLEALAHVTKGLELMAVAGFNHRDIAPGNILVEGPKEDKGDKKILGRIIDYEFLKEYNSNEGGAGERTGTLDFMAIEVYLGQTKFKKSGTEAFRHNAGHDLESIVWITIYLIYITPVEEGMDADKAATLRQHMLQFFSPTERISNFMSPSSCGVMVEHFENETVKLAIRNHVVPMVEALKKKYEAFLATDEERRKNSDFAEVHKLFHTTLLKLSKLFSTIPTVRLQNVSKKRQHSDEPEASPTAKRQM